MTLVLGIISNLVGRFLSSDMHSLYLYEKIRLQLLSKLMNGFKKCIISYNLKSSYISSYS